MSSNYFCSETVKSDPDNICYDPVRPQVTRDIIFLRLLIAEPIPLATIRALPGNTVARHAPEVFVHAFLANM